jgi:hypothetical protein
MKHNVRNPKGRFTKQTLTPWSEPSEQPHYDEALARLAQQSQPVDQGTGYHRLYATSPGDTDTHYVGVTKDNEPGKDMQPGESYAQYLARTQVIRPADMHVIAEASELHAKPGPGKPIYQHSSRENWPLAAAVIGALMVIGIAAYFGFMVL